MKISLLYPTDAVLAPVSEKSAVTYGEMTRIIGSVLAFNHSELQARYTSETDLLLPLISTTYISHGGELTLFTSKENPVPIRSKKIHVVEGNAQQLAVTFLTDTDILLCCGYSKRMLPDFEIIRQNWLLEVGAKKLVGISEFMPNIVFPEEIVRGMGDFVTMQSYTTLGGFIQSFAHTSRSTTLTDPG